MKFHTVTASKLGPNNYVVIGDNRSGTVMAVIHRKRIAGKVFRRGSGIVRSSAMKTTSETPPSQNWTL